MSENKTHNFDVVIQATKYKKNFCICISAYDTLTLFCRVSA